MGELGAFLKIHRVGFDKRDPRQRVRDYRQYFDLQPEEELSRQAARCMDCGIPFCHEGCPLGNLIPDWNDLVYRGKWREAADQLHLTNNFPEFTGRICPAPVRVGLRAGHQRRSGQHRANRDGHRRAGLRRGLGGARAPLPAHRAEPWPSMGSGPAGLAVAAELNLHGHTVTVYERDEGPGGLMRFGVPDAKLEKRVIDRRVDILEQEGVRFVYDVDVGRDIDARELASEHDALVVCVGSRVSRDLAVPGRDLAGIHLAMDYLYQRNRWVAAQEGRPFRPVGARRRDHGGGEEGDRDWRWRHRHGLHL